MLIDIAIIYTLGLAFLVIFLISKKYRRNRQNSEVTKTEKFLNCLSLVSLTWIFMSAFMVFLMELAFVLYMPQQDWFHIVEFLNDRALSSSSFLSWLTMPLLISVAIPVIGYYMKLDLLNELGKSWEWILLALYVIVGIVGMLTGLLV